MRVEWSDDLLIGIAHIDEQHKGIFKLLDDLCTAIEDNRSYVVLKDTVWQLASYSRIHFIAEENYMDIKGYSERYVHMGIHAEFHKTVLGYINRILEGDTSFALEVAKFVHNWLLTHISIEDMKLREL